MAAFDRPYMTYYQSAVVTIALSRIISEIKRDIRRKSRFFRILALSRIISEIKRDIRRKSRFFRILAFDTPVRGSSPELLPYGLLWRN